MFEGIKKPESKETPGQYLLDLAERSFASNPNTTLESYPEDDWRLTTINFDNASIDISRQATELSRTQIKELVTSTREYKDAVYRNEKPEYIGLGGGGSVYMLGDDFVLKESINIEVEEDACENVSSLQEVMDENPGHFPDNFHLVHPLALIRSKNGGFDHDTTYGEINNERDSSVGAYVVMPYISNAIQLDDLIPASKKEGSPLAQAQLKKLVSMGIIECEDELCVKSFLDKKRFEIIDMFKSAQTGSYDRVSIQDTTPRNILFRFEADIETGEEVPNFYKIDHAL